VMVPERVWDEDQGEALDLKPVLSVEAGGDKLLLLRRGGAIGDDEERLFSQVVSLFTLAGRTPSLGQDAFHQDGPGQRRGFPNPQAGP
jgi:hypothetical protein